MTINISRLSNEPIYIPVRIANPVNTADENIIGSAVRVAVVQSAPVSADWSTASIEGTWIAPDGETYFVVKHTLTASASPVGVQQAWVEVTYDSNVYVLRAGPVRFY